MFTGFASENTPAIQVWDFFRTFASTGAVRSVSLADDCAPIQVFRTGATTSSVIRVYLPTAPIEGKQITIVNQPFDFTAQNIVIYSSDRSEDGSLTALFTLGAADSLNLVYSKQNITYGLSSGTSQTGWISLNKSSPSATNAFSAVVGGNFNAAAAQSSFVGGGTSNTASGSSAAVVGGSSNTASGTSNAILGGASNSSSGANSAMLGGSSNITNAQNSTVVGGSYGTTRSIQANTVSPASFNPIAFVVGTSQSALLVLGVQTTNATATVLRSNTSAAGTTNQVILPDNSAYFFRGEVIAGVTGAGDTKGWTVEGVIKRGAGVGTTALVGTPTVTSLYADAGATTWSITATADTTRGGLAITVTGQAATTIRWVAQIRTTEMTY